MKTIYFLLFSIGTVALMGCPSPSATPTPTPTPVVVTVSEKMAKNWTVSLVREGTTVVFTVGAATNVRPGYVNFKMNLTGTTGAVAFTDFDGTLFSGQWEIQGDTKLILKNLSPQPTGTNGTIEFTISALTANSVTITRTTASAKTGNTINEYQLTWK